MGKRLRFAPSPGIVRKLRAEMRRLATELGASEATGDHLALVADEIVNNAIEHGAGYRQRGELLALQVAVDGPRLRVEFSDPEMPVEVDWTRPRGGFFVWLTLPRGIDTSALLAKAIGRRVAYVPGRGFYDDGSGGDQLRLCFSFPPSERIREGVSRLAELLHDELGLLRAVYGEGAPELAGRRDEAGRS